MRTPTVIKRTDYSMHSKPFWKYLGLTQKHCQETIFSDKNIDYLFIWVSLLLFYSFQSCTSSDDVTWHKSTESLLCLTIGRRSEKKYPYGLGSFGISLHLTYESKQQWKHSSGHNEYLSTIFAIADFIYDGSFCSFYLITSERPFSKRLDSQFPDQSGIGYFNTCIL